MEKYYTSERNAQIVIALLKANNIRKIILILFKVRAIMIFNLFIKALVNAL